LLYKTEGDKGTMTINKYAMLMESKFVEEMSIDAAGQHVDAKIPISKSISRFLMTNLNNGV
jgi:hypothetical protein